MSAVIISMTLRLRARSILLTGIGMVAVIVMVGALFPSVGDSIGKLDLPEGVSDLLGGADYGTLAGWMRSEIGAVYGPLVIGAMAIVVAAGSMAGEEEAGVFAVLLAGPVSRTGLIVSKAAAMGCAVLAVAASTWVGLLAGVAIGGGGVSVADLSALAIHLAFFGVAVGSVALAAAGWTGSKAVATAIAAGFALFGFLVNGFAPLIGGLEWLKYLSVFHYYSGSDPISGGIDGSNLAVLACFSLALVLAAVPGFRRRDLRG